MARGCIGLLTTAIVTSSLALTLLPHPCFPYKDHVMTLAHPDLPGSCPHPEVLKLIISQVPSPSQVTHSQVPRIKTRAFLGGLLFCQPQGRSVIFSRKAAHRGCERPTGES